MIFGIGDRRERLTENIIINSYIIFKKLLDVRFMFFDDLIDETSRAGAAWGRFRTFACKCSDMSVRFQSCLIILLQNIIGSFLREIFLA